MIHKELLLTDFKGEGYIFDTIINTMYVHINVCPCIYIFLFSILILIIIFLLETAYFHGCPIKLIKIQK